MTLLAATVLFSLPSADRPLILAHVVPWFEADPDAGRYGWHWTMDRFNPAADPPTLASHYKPAIGPYDSGDRAVIEYHLLLMRAAGIDGVIVDWYGRTDLNDYAPLHRNTTRLLQECERLNMRFAVCYEDQTVPKLVAAGRLAEADRVSHAAAEIDWLGRYWFRSGSYARVDAKPLLLSFGFGGLTADEWSRVLRRVQTPVAYFSQNAPRPGAAGAFDWPVPSKGLKAQAAFLRRAERMPAAIPAAYPRFHDVYAEAGVTASYGRIPDGDGRTFRRTLARAVAGGAPVVQIVTWNDWGEGTQVEPSEAFGVRDLRAVQDVRRQLDAEFPFTADDLAFPRRLLEARRLGTTPGLDEASAAFAAGEAETAAGAVP